MISFNGEWCFPRGQLPSDHREKDWVPGSDVRCQLYDGISMSQGYSSLNHNIFENL